MGAFIQKATLFADLDQGGYIQNYELYDGDKLIGHKCVVRETRKANEHVAYMLIGDEREYTSVIAFSEAYKARLDL